MSTIQAASAGERVGRDSSRFGSRVSGESVFIGGFIPLMQKTRRSRKHGVGHSAYGMGGFQGGAGLAGIAGRAGAIARSSMPIILLSYCTVKTRKNMSTMSMIYIILTINKQYK